MPALSVIVPSYEVPRTAPPTEKDADDNPAAQPEVARKKHLDFYEIDLAVLTGGPYAAAVHSNPDYAAAYCRAFNDWTLDHWVSADPRFKASIHISQSSPPITFTVAAISSSLAGSRVISDIFKVSVFKF